MLTITEQRMLLVTARLANLKERINGTQDASKVLAFAMAAVSSIDATKSDSVRSLPIADQIVF